MFKNKRAGVFRKERGVAVDGVAGPAALRRQQLPPRPRAAAAQFDPADPKNSTFRLYSFSSEHHLNLTVYLTVQSARRTGL